MVIHVEQGKEAATATSCCHRNCSASFVHIGDWRDPRTGCFPDAIPSIRSTLSCCTLPAARHVPRRVWRWKRRHRSHTAPPSFATHLLEGGTDIRASSRRCSAIATSNTTTRYAQVASQHHSQSSKPTRPSNAIRLGKHRRRLRRDGASHAGGGGYLLAAATAMRSGRSHLGSPRQDRATCHGGAESELCRAIPKQEARRAVRRLRAGSLRLQLLPQPPIVRECRGSGARRDGSRRVEAEFAADAVPPRGLHLPPPVAEIAFQNKQAVYAILFHAAAEAMRAIAARPRHLGAEIGAARGAARLGADPAAPSASALHCPRRWPFHAGSNSKWVACRPGFFLPVQRPLAAIVPNIVPIARLQAAFVAGELRFSGTLAALADSAAFAERLDALRAVEWVVYAKRPFAGPEQVLAYLGRYTHRVALANSRLTRLADGQVDFTWKDYRHHDKTKKVMTLAADGDSFRSSLLHAVPKTGSTASAHVGFLAERPAAPQSWRCAVLCSQPRRQSHRMRRRATASAPTPLTGHTTRCLSGLWRRDCWSAGRCRADPQPQAPFWWRQLMTKTGATQLPTKASCDADSPHPGMVRRRPTTDRYAPLPRSSTVPDTSSIGPHHHATGRSGRHRDAKNQHQGPGVLRAATAQRDKTPIASRRHAGSGSIRLQWGRPPGAWRRPCHARPHRNLRFRRGENFDS